MQNGENARPWVLALLALRRPRVPVTDTQYVVLTRPVPAQVELQVVRTDGAVAYVGTIDAAVGGWSFTVADADRPQTVPTALAGTVDAGPDRTHRRHGRHDAGAPPHDAFERADVEGALRIGAGASTAR